MAMTYVQNVMGRIVYTLVNYLMGKVFFYDRGAQF